MPWAIEATFLFQGMCAYTVVLGRQHPCRVSPRLIHSARVVEGKICYDIKDANQIYELFYTRFSLHKRIYNHKTSAYFMLRLSCGLMDMGHSESDRVHDHRCAP